MCLAWLDVSSVGRAAERHVTDLSPRAEHPVFTLVCQSCCNTTTYWCCFIVILSVQRPDVAAGCREKEEAGMMDCVCVCVGGGGVERDELFDDVLLQTIHLINSVFQSFT